MKLKTIFNFRFLLILILILVLLIIGIIWKRYISKEEYKEIDICNINYLSIRNTDNGQLKSGKKDNDHPLIAYKELDLSECQLTKINNFVAHSLTFSILKLPKNIEDIGWGSFANNKSLTEIEFPRSLKIIGSKAFMLCSGLTKVTFNRIPSSRYYDESHIQILEQAFNFTKVVNVVINLRGNETFKYIDDVDGKLHETADGWLKRLFSNPQHDLESEGGPNLKITRNTSTIISDSQKIPLKFSVTGKESLDKPPNSILPCNGDCNNDEQCKGNSVCIFRVKSEFPYINSRPKERLMYGCSDPENLLENPERTDTDFCSNPNPKQALTTKPPKTTTTTTKAPTQCPIITNPPTTTTPIDPCSIKCKETIDYTSCNIKYIDNREFQGCADLITIKLPSELNSIGEYAFDGCTKLKNINIPQYITIIKEGTFNNCSSIENIDLSEIKSIENNVFNECSSLKNIDLSNITSIGTNAFNGCLKLISLNLSNLKRIEDNCFANCSSLETITIKNPITIGTSAFYNCNNLKIVTILCSDDNKNYDNIKSYFSNYNANNTIKYIIDTCITTTIAPTTTLSTTKPPIPTIHTDCDAEYKCPNSGNIPCIREFDNSNIEDDLCEADINTIADTNVGYILNPNQIKWQNI